MRQFF